MNRAKSARLIKQSGLQNVKPPIFCINYNNIQLVITQCLKLLKLPSGIKHYLTKCEKSRSLPTHLVLVHKKV